MCVCMADVQKFLTDTNNQKKLGFPGGSVVKNLPTSAGDMGSIPDPGRSPTCLGATKPLYYNYCALQPGRCNY